MNLMRLYAGLAQATLRAAPFAVWLFFIPLVSAATGTAEEMRIKDQWIHTHLDGSQPPFSFISNGEASPKFLARWKKTSTTRKLDAERTERTLVWSDARAGLEIRLVAIDYQDFPALEWLVYFKNTGRVDSPMLEAIRPLDVPQSAAGFVIHHAPGDGNSGLSFAPQEETVSAADPRERVFAPTGGRSSQGCMPYFNLEWKGGGVALAIGWSGQWEAGFQAQPDGQFRLRAGQQHTHFRLHAGESVRTPRVVLAFWQGDDALRGNNLFRSLALAHYYPRREGQLVFPPICGTVNYTAPDGSYEQPHLIAPAPLRERGVEVLWSDMDPQQWYPVGFPNGTGNWEVDLAKYPRGLEPIGNAVRAAGIEYLLWFEPERVHPGTRIDREHPEWVMRAKGEWSELFRLHDPAARRWLTGLLDAHITTANIRWVRWDFNIDPLGFWQRNDTPDRQGITEIRHIEGLYAMWEELEKRHPGLMIDNCSSGGRRLDIETFRYGLPLWHSDLQCSGQCAPTADQLQNAALYRWIPLHGCGNFALEPAYGFRSAMTAGNILAPSETGCRVDTPKLTVETAVKRTTALYRKLRPFMLGDFYPLFSHTTNSAAWFGYQFHRPQSQDGFALLFRRENAANATQVIALRGLEANTTYAIHFEDTTSTCTLTGAQLGALNLEIPTAPNSAILYYQPVSSPAPPPEPRGKTARLSPPSSRR